VGNVVGLVVGDVVGYGDGLVVGSGVGDVVDEGVGLIVGLGLIWLMFVLFPISEPSIAPATLVLLVPLSE
jgi:hypothetical protein